MPSPWWVDVVRATDPVLCGGKAVGLGNLARAGFPAPPAVCLTTEFYRHWVETSGLASELAALWTEPGDADLRRDQLAKLGLRFQVAALSDGLLASLSQALAPLTGGWDGALTVRSSGVNEDAGGASYAGIHSSFVVPADVGAVVEVLRRCWASLWTERAWTYRERFGVPHEGAAMAVVVQRFVVPERSGVVFSVDPLTSDPATVVVEAGWGTGAALVSGRITPDDYRVAVSDGAVCRRAGRQEEMSAWYQGEERLVPLPQSRQGVPVLTDEQARELARLAMAVEAALDVPVDVEWVFDGARFWAVQARPITTLARGTGDTPPAGTLWTRANLKEVFPELPSPLALSYLARSLNLMFETYHAAQGFTLPPQARLVGVFRGRPYLNLSLMQRMTLERGGDPAVVARLFGGARGPSSAGAAPAPAPPGRANRLRLAREMAATFFRTPYRGRRLFRAMRRKAAALRALSLEALDDAALLAHLEGLRTSLLGRHTVRRLHEVVSAQSRAYMALEVLLAAWTDGDASTLLKRLMTGLGTLPNVRMTYRLMALGTLAVRDARARAFFGADLTPAAVAGVRTALAGTALLDGLDEFLREFGHRGPYESDVMSPRFADDLAPVLRIIQLYVRADVCEDPAHHAAERRRLRAAATAEVRAALGRGRGRLVSALRRGVFAIGCDALQRLLALRDECRHVSTMMVAHLRRVALEIGRRAVRDGRLASADDVFFLEWDELPRVLADRTADWRALARRRRQARARHQGLEAPDLLGADGAPDDDASPASADELRGFGVSPGTVTGVVRVVRSAEDVGRLSGDIVVFPAIEPTLTPLFPLVRGLVAEMGGLLSHAAILAREYGLPAVVGARDATRWLHDGDRIELNGTTGRIRVLERAR